ncbi:MAG: hypothetical protein AAFX94_02915 [Myxococcota bacterium]
MVALVGCGADEAPALVDSGTVTMRLTASDSDGALYRLVNATFRIRGPRNLTVTSTVGEDTLSVDLPVGIYSVRLQDGWSMEVSRDGGATFEAVNAVLDVPSTLGVQVDNQETSPLFFSFLAGEDVIEFGDGRIEIGIQVNAPEPEGDPVASIPCGATVCEDEVCCIGSTEVLGCFEDVPACLTSTAGAASIACNDASDCGAGTVCCYDSASISFSCSSTCGVESTAEAPACSSTDLTCPAGTTCNLSFFSTADTGLDLGVCLADS